MQTSRTLTARGLADTLHHASPRPTARAPQHLVAGLIPDATLGLTDTDMLRALRERYALIEQRADARTSTLMNLCSLQAVGDQQGSSC